ncbi:porin family protein [Empedobacter sp. UBA6745]|uniref:porin family protein n=1 Tax=Empedobacter sp. UBA6745 TaxID=1946447 RepID=UPI0025BF608D|nr:porin family protein [Empedobacter sp. UBA6745]
MKKLLFTALVAVSSFASAQSIDFGAKAGIVFNADNGFWEGMGEVSEGNGSTGFQVGAMLRARFAGFYVQPELMYTQFKNEYDVDGQKLNVTKKRMDIPVNVGKRFLGIGHIQAGPVFSYYFDDKLSVKDFTTAKQDEFNVGMQIGAGVEVSKLLFDLRYEFGLGKVGSDILNGSNGQYRTENRPQMLNLSVAYLF